MNILLVCPTNRWSSKERRLLSDAIFLKNSGHNPIIYCLRDSFLDLRAKSNNINREYPSEKVLTKGKFKYDLRDYKNLFQKYEFSAVHCYEIYKLWPLSYFLRNKLKLPLFLSLYENIENYHISFFKRWLLNRVDSLFIPTSVMRDNVLSHLSIKSKKIEAIGVGIEADLKDHRNIEEKVNFGISVNGDEEDAKEIEIILQGIKLFSEKYNKNFSIFLYSARTWREHLIYRELNFAFEALMITEKIKLVDNFTLSSDYSDIDIFISTSTNEVLNDWTLKAMMEGVPTLAPRTAQYQELKRAFGDILETYKIGDRREMSNKLKLVVDNYTKLSKQLKSKHDLLVKELGPQIYEQKFNEIYSRMIRKRDRFLKRKKST